MNTQPKPEIELPPKQGGSAVVTLPATPPQSPVTTQAMLSMAVASGNTDLAQKVMDLQERWDLRNARKAFDAAIAKAKAEIPVIIKNREMNAGAGRTSYKYEDMAAIARVIDPILSKHGLGYRFRTHAATDLITVTCIIFHEEGHSEENSLPGKPDASGSKNSIQAVGSTVTYLERYTLKAALGLAASADADATTDPETIDSEQYAELTKLITEVGADITKFLRYFKVDSLDDLPALKYQSAVDALNAKRPK